MAEDTEDYEDNDVGEDNEPQPESRRNNLDRLVSELPQEERRELLDKLKGLSNISGDPLYDDEEARKTSRGDSGEQFSKLPWYLRLWYTILSIFQSKPPGKLYEAVQIDRIARAVETTAPGLYDGKKSLLLPPFHAQLEKLKESARFFYTALDAGFNRDKGAFYAFIASLEMEPVHTRILQTTNPQTLTEQHPGVPDADLRLTAQRALEAALDDITPEMRETMYFDARSLFCLKELASFLFDRVLMAFSFDTQWNGQTCSILVVKDMLVTLNNILYSLKTIPPMSLLEGLFVFLLQETPRPPRPFGADIELDEEAQAEEDRKELEEELKALLNKAGSSLGVIRDFNRKVPLTRLLRCAYRRPELSPREITGGEDWFIVYRDYWKNHIDDEFAEFTRQRKQAALMDSFRFFFNDAVPTPLAHTASPEEPDAIPLQGAFGLSFLLSFYQQVFMKSINNALRPILIDGDFSRKDNRVEFAESYNELIKMEDIIHQLEVRIAPKGDYGRRYAQARQSTASLSVKRRQEQQIVEEASTEALSILGAARRAADSMIRLLGGILEPDERAKEIDLPDKDKDNGIYDTLFNLQQMIKLNDHFLEGVAETLEKFKRFAQILSDIDVLE